MGRKAEEVLRNTSSDVSTLRANAWEEARGLMDSVLAENDRVWSLEDNTKFALELSGAKTLQAPDPLPSRSVMPFGPTHNPFNGYGTYGAKPPQGPPRGFKEETKRRLYEARDPLPQVPY